MKQQNLVAFMPLALETNLFMSKYAFSRSFCFCCVKDHASENSEGIKKVIRAEYESLGRVRLKFLLFMYYLLINLIN